jgi:hypothetical protein
MVGDRARVYVPTLQESAEVWAVVALGTLYWVADAAQAKRIAFQKFRAHKRQAGPWRGDRFALDTVEPLLWAAFWQLGAPEGEA